MVYVSVCESERERETDGQSANIALFFCFWTCLLYVRKYMFNKCNNAQKKLLLLLEHVRAYQLILNNVFIIYNINYQLKHFIKL